MNNVLDWLEASTARSPEATAFADEFGEITFAQLEGRAQAIAAQLIDIAAPQSGIAVFARKSTRAITAMMGAVYARCFYCVLDDRQPEARLASILGTLAPAAMLVDEAHLEIAHALCDERGIPVFEIDALSAHALTEEERCALKARRATALDIDPLYVNFTSGSTGTPKGVVVSHRSTIDFIGYFTRLFSITADDRIANQAPFDFDVSVKDIYSGLAVGAAVHLIPREYFSVPVQLMDFLCERNVTICTWAVSALCFVSIMGGLDYRTPETIRAVIFSGEIMPPKQLNIWRAHLPNTLYANVYGPTEVTCNCTYYLLDREFAKDETIPMGVPFENEHVFLLDEHDAEIAPTQIGEQGEICVSGTALALGYLGDAEKTAAAFVQNPLNKRWNETIYRTGDLAFYDADGLLVYAGRKDHQIKHMGQRIELGEIETVAQALDGVARACCIYNERRKRLLLYYEGDAEKDEVAAAMHEKLPSFMMPNKITQMPQLPLTKNGKIDRMQLASK